MSRLETRRPPADVRTETIARRFASLADLSPAETALLHEVGASPTTLWAPRSLIDPVGEHISQHFQISGWAARVRELKDGRRQFLQLVLPGDALAPLLQVRDRQQTIQCLTVSRTVDGTAIRLAARDSRKFPGIAAAVELAAAHDRALLLDQVTRLGRQTAYERVANLFIELHYRCSQVGLVHGNGFAFPLTQEAIGDLLGLSLVHVNRTLQLMRRESMIALKQGRLMLLNLPELQAIADFRPPQIEHLG
jgi:CRP-like cAMP-binding protein